MHHIVSDGWSMGVLISELSALYSAFLRGEADPLPELAIQYADYAVWQRQWIEGDILQQQAEYWKTTLAGAPALLELPADHPRPAQQDYAGAFAGLVLDEKLTAGLKASEQASRHDALHDSAGCLGGAAGEAVWAAGCGHRHTRGQPRTGRDRRPDRILRQHPGAACGSVGLADRQASCSSG